MSDKQITVTNIRAHDIERLPVATDTVISYPGAGTGSDILGFLMDSPSPAARSMVQGVDGLVYGQPFLGAVRINLKQGDNQDLTLRFEATAAAYRFSIAIDYDLDGKRYTEIVKRPESSAPLRLGVSASLCGKPEGIPISEEDKRTFDGLQYRSVYELGVNTTGAYQLNTTDPKTFKAKGCKGEGGAG